MKLVLLIELVAAMASVQPPHPANACGRTPQAGCASVPPRPDQVLLRDTDDFGYWMTYSQRGGVVTGQRVDSEMVDAHIDAHLGGTLHSGVATRDVSRLLARMHLSQFPLHYSVTLLSRAHQRAVERVHWQMPGGRGPLVRLAWTSSIIGWSITAVTYLRNR